MLEDFSMHVRRRLALGTPRPPASPPSTLIRLQMKRRSILVDTCQWLQWSLEPCKVCQYQRRQGHLVTSSRRQRCRSGAARDRQRKQGDRKGSPTLMTTADDTHLLKARVKREPDDEDRVGAEAFGSRATTASGASPSVARIAGGSRPSLCSRVMHSIMSRHPARRLSPYLNVNNNKSLQKPVWKRQAKRVQPHGCTM